MKSKYTDFVRGQTYFPSKEDLVLLRQLIEVEKLQQRIVAERLNWPLRRVEKLVVRYRLKTQRTGPRSGEGHPNWRGGRIVDKSGYVLVYAPESPLSRKNGYALEHRLVMSAILGRWLTPKEVVHHKNKDKSDNRIQNLRLFGTNGMHLADELTGRVPNWTPAGFARMLRGSRKPRSRKRSKRNASAPRQTLVHSTDGTHREDPDPSGMEPAPL